MALFGCVFITFADGIKVDPTKIVAMKECSRPKTPTDICSLLGLAGYCMRFIKDYSKIVGLLTNLKKNT